MKKDMKKKSSIDGFTLIEILAVIIIIGIVAIIAIPSISKYLGSSRETVYTSYENSMEEAAKNRIVDCISGNGDCEMPEGDEEQKIYLEKLIEEGYLDNMKDPETKNFCDQLVSYVSVKGDSASDYKFKACLYCGDYYTDDEDCKQINGDSEPPECGTVTGGSTRWTNQNRTITIGCSDKSSGCLQSVFSKTFSRTTPKNEQGEGKGTITIRDRSGETTECKVDAYVDKTAPSCNITLEGEYIGSVGWYSLEATAKLSEKTDADSGILTYGMGKSVKNKEYNKLTELTVGGGITTVVGYVKDIAENEDICTKDVRVGTEIPKFNLFYGYLVYPDTNYATLNAPKITINNTSKYKSVQKVLVTLNSQVTSQTTATIKSGSMTKTVTVTQGSKEIVFVFSGAEIKSYSSFELTLGTGTTITSKINKIEILTKDGSAWTNKDITLYVEPIDAGMRTTEVTFDNKATAWTNVFSKYSLIPALESLPCWTT